MEYDVCMNAHRTAAAKGMKTAITLAVLMAGCLSFAAGLTAKQKKQYRELRKQFFLVLPLPAKKGTKTRREVKRYFSRLNHFIEETETISPGHAAAARYYRGRMDIKLRRFKTARKDFDACLRTLAELKAAGKPLPRGLPSACAIRIYRAFAFLPDGHEKIADELEAIPETAGKPRYHEVGPLVANWADALADSDQPGLALRAYRIVKRFDLWEEEADDPQRKINLLKVQLGGRLNPEDADDRNKQQEPPGQDGKQE